MICVEFLAQPQGSVVGFRMEGHAGYGEEGTDIVCAAVSSAAYLTANAITEVLGVCPLSLRVQEGEMFLRIEPKDEPTCRDFFTALRIHLTGLEEQYSGYLKVSYLEL
jgi:uncharacterized protein YsxB (DUF464 family)